MKENSPIWASPMPTRRDVRMSFPATNAPMDQVSNAITGRFTDQTMWYLILGIAAAVGGVLLVAFGRRR